MSDILPGTPIEVQEAIQNKTKYGLVEWLSNLIKGGRVANIPSSTLRTVIETEQDPDYIKHIEKKKAPPKS